MSFGQVILDSYVPAQFLFHLHYVNCHKMENCSSNSNFGLLELNLYRREAVRHSQCGVPQVPWLKILHPLVTKALLLASSKCCFQRFKKYASISFLSIQLDSIPIFFCCVWLSNIVVNPIQEQENSEGKLINYQCRCSFVEVLNIS